MKDLRFILILITLGIFSSGCEKEQPAPDLPPAASFIMEFDDIWKQAPSPGSYPSGDPQSNFIFAATSVYWWNTVLSIQLAIPVAAFM